MNDDRGCLPHSVHEEESLSAGNRASEPAGEEEQGIDHPLLTGAEVGRRLAFHQGMRALGPDGQGSLSRLERAVSRLESTQRKPLVGRTSVDAWVA